MRHFVIPKDTTWIGGADWGFNAPGVIILAAHVGDNHWHVVRELKFQRETVEDVARRYKAMLAELGKPKVSYIACDPAMFVKTGHVRGESIAETLQRYGLPMIKGDNDRKNGWQRVHELLRIAPDGFPWLTVDVSCTYGRRSIPAQMSDKTDPDDIDTHGDDHWVDALRYLAMSRFVASKRSPKSSPPHMSMGWLKQRAEVPAGILSRRVG